MPSSGREYTGLIPGWFTAEKQKSKVKLKIITPGIKSGLMDFRNKKYSSSPVFDKKESIFVISQIAP